jgi:hypothetical protein
MPRGANNLTPEQLEKMAENEAWFKIVVKVLRWKDGAIDFGDLAQLEKISKKEWKQYCETMLKKNVVYGKKKTQENLDALHKKITDYDGFQ